MRTDTGAADAVVKIRTPRHGWLPMAVIGVVILCMGLDATIRLDRTLRGSFPLVMGPIFVVEALWIRTFGVDLTTQVARLRGLRRRNIPWTQVQAVAPYIVLGQRMVRLFLKDGTKVRLRAPATLLGIGDSAFERDYHRIGQWWLAYHDPAAKPAGPDLPPSST